jgi:hypothetical protein
MQLVKNSKQKTKKEKKSKTEKKGEVAYLAAAQPSRPN